MRINGVENTFNNTKNYNNKQTVSKGGLENGFSRPQGPSFMGMDLTTGMIDFWAAVARGGLAASFTIQDMTGTNFPRTIAALDRNKDITGKNNYKAAVEVAIREFTTGPSMFIIPALVIGTASRMSGEANKVPVNNIADLSEVMKTTMARLNDTEFKNIDFAKLSVDEAKQAQLAIKRAFYEDVFKGIFAQYTEGDGKVNLSHYVDLILKAEDPSTPKRNFILSMMNKKVKVLGREVESKDEIITSVIQRFAKDKKANSGGWGNFLSAKILPTSGECSVADIIEDIKNYSNDFTKQFITQKRTPGVPDTRVLLNKFIDNFRDKRIGTRFITSSMMIVATGLFMMFIPKLYTRNKTNPETDAIYEQVNERRKGAVNANR